MKKKFQISDSPEILNENWDRLANCYFQKREFLSLLHKFNPCKQRYYELYNDDLLVAGTVVYTLKINLLTFSYFHLPFKMKVIGLPASVATPPVIGESVEFEYLVNEILKLEKGLTICLNLKADLLKSKVICLRTLPTIIFRNQFPDFENYLMSLRHHYRRRIVQMQNKFTGVSSKVTDCSAFCQTHYELYLEIMKRTRTKLEILRLEFFQNLPDNFVLTTHYHNVIMLSWQISCKDEDTLFFLFGGMNYQKRNSFHSYHNNLISILKFCIDKKYKYIDFGQTAETAKLRLGGELEERKMFIYHPNFIIHLMLKLFKGLFSYAKTTVQGKIFNDQVYY